MSNLTLGMAMPLMYLLCFENGLRMEIVGVVLFMLMVAITTNNNT